MPNLRQPGRDRLEVPAPAPHEHQRTALAQLGRDPGVGVEKREQVLPRLQSADEKEVRRRQPETPQPGLDDVDRQRPQLRPDAEVGARDALGRHAEDADDLVADEVADRHDVGRLRDRRKLLDEFAGSLGRLEIGEAERRQIVHRDDRRQVARQDRQVRLVVQIESARRQPGGNLPEVEPLRRPRRGDERRPQPRPPQPGAAGQRRRATIQARDQTSGNAADARSAAGQCTQRRQELGGAVADAGASAEGRCLMKGDAQHGPSLVPNRPMISGIVTSGKPDFPVLSDPQTSPILPRLPPVSTEATLGAPPSSPVLQIAKCRCERQSGARK